MSKIVYIGETNHLFTKDKKYVSAYEDRYSYHILDSDSGKIGYLTIMSKKDGIPLDKWRELRINEIIEE